jgi:ABC-type transport system involved in cytochrome c biogenesis permease subunit
MKQRLTTSWVAGLVVALAALWVLAGLRPPPARSAFDTAAFGRLPVLLNGRVQPIDSVARNSLLVIRGRQSVALTNGGSLSATDWLVALAMKPEQADQLHLFRVDHPELRGLLRLPPEGTPYLAYAELEPQLAEVDKQARHAESIEPANRSTFEKAVLKLGNGLIIYQRLKNSFRPEGTDDFRAELAAYQQALGPGLAASTAREQGKPFDEAAMRHLSEWVQRFQALAEEAYPLIIPPTHPELRRDDWSNIGTALLAGLQTGQVPPAAMSYAAMVTAYRQNQPVEFNRAVTGYQASLAGRFGTELRQGRYEFVFNYWRPFVKSTTLYLVVFLLGWASWFGAFRLLNRTAFWLLVLAFLLHTAGLAFRVILQGRPPVTNLYSSAVFVGWGAVILGLLLERFYRDGIGLVMASAVGFVTQIIAHNLAFDGDTMEMMRAVLDSNFWLTTHVLTVTLGYSAMFVAGFLAALYVVRGFFTRSLSATTARALARMVYGVVCFATLFSFVGTILGGIWADQSWGRFWGWDPKENGALLIVLWNAVILHARWGGLVRERGLMNLALFGNIVTAFSWFGVNMLGVGLHSYGFMQSAFVWLMIFIASQLALIGLGLLPDPYWASFRPRPAVGPAAPLPTPAPVSGKMR